MNMELIARGERETSNPCPRQIKMMKTTSSGHLLDFCMQACSTEHFAKTNNSRSQCATKSPHASFCYQTSSRCRLRFNSQLAALGSGFRPPIPQPSSRHLHICERCYSANAENLGKNQHSHLRSSSESLSFSVDNTGLNQNELYSNSEVFQTPT